MTSFSFSDKKAQKGRGAFCLLVSTYTILSNSKTFLHQKVQKTEPFLKYPIFLSLSETILLLHQSNGNGDLIFLNPDSHRPPRRSSEPPPQPQHSGGGPIQQLVVPALWLVLRTWLHQQRCQDRSRSGGFRERSGSDLGGDELVPRLLHGG